jgi:hypothetical protein
MTTHVLNRLSPRSRTIAPAFAITRAEAASGPSVGIEQVRSHISRLLQAQLADIAAGAETSYAVEPARTFGGFGSAAALERHVEEWRFEKQNALPHVMDLVIPVGHRFVTPPYDHDWATGAATPLAKLDGTMLVFGAEGFSANGVSMMLSSTEPLLTSVIPQGVFDFSWASLDNYPSLRSRGGLGILVYENANPAPVLERQSVLWSVAGVSQFTGGQGSGRFADATMPSAPFGPIPLAPAVINMLPGRSYELWMWVWQVAHYGVASPAFLSFLRCKMPLVQVDAGPPINIH